MKNSVALCILAMTFYALEIALTDWKLSKISPKAITLFYALGVATLAGINLIFAKEIKFPQGTEWGFTALMVVVSFVAALAHFAAIHNGCGAVTMFYCLMPVVASLFSVLFKLESPDWRTAAAWILAVLALYLASTGKTGTG